MERSDDVLAERLDQIAVQRQVAHRFGQEDQWDEALSRLRAVEEDLDRVAAAHPAYAATQAYRTFRDRLVQERRSFEERYAAWKAGIEARNRAFLAHEREHLAAPIEGPPLPPLPGKRARKVQRFRSERHPREQH